MTGWRCVGGALLAAGLLSVLCGVLAFFPAGSYRPWFISWDAKIAAPLWTGALWELAYTFAILSSLTSLLMFSVAVVAVLTGPLCYYSYLGVVGTGYLSHAVLYPYPYQAGPGLCLDPPGAEWYHLGVRTLDLLASATIFTASLGVTVRLTIRLLRYGHVNVSR